MEKAVDGLRRFRVTQLLEPAAHPTGKVVRTDSEGSARKAKQVAERIKGIEHDFGVRTTPDANGTEFVLYGNVYRGNAEIAVFLENRNQNERAVVRSVASTFGAFLKEGFMEFGGLAVAAVTATRSDSPIDLSTPVIAIPLAAIGVDAARRIVGMARSLDFHNGGFTSQVKSALATDIKDGANPWVFHSYDVVLDQDAFRGAINHIPDWSDIGANSQLKNELSRFKAVGERTKVQVEELLSFESDGTPVLTVMVRGHEKKPRYPQRAPEPQRSLLKSIADALAPPPKPIPIPISD